MALRSERLAKPVAPQRLQQILNSLNSLRDSLHSSTTSVTCATGGPLCAHAANILRFRRRPSATISTVPSGRLRAQPPEAEPISLVCSGAAKEHALHAARDEHAKACVVIGVTHGRHSLASLTSGGCPVRLRSWASSVEGSTRSDFPTRALFGKVYLM